MPAPPLSHHEILGLVEPFTRRGRHVDLAASDREARRLTFKAPPDAGGPERADAVREALLLDLAEAGTCVLIRKARHPGGLEAVLQARGEDPAALLAAVEGIPLERHFTAGAGFLIARSYRMSGVGTGPPPPPALTQATVRVEGLELSLVVPSVTGIAADLSLTPTAGHDLALPEDLLAVLGWNWSRLVRGRRGWSGKLRLRGRTPQRTQRAEAALDRAAAHLARTLGEPPASYHDRLRAARWAVFFRRGIPTLTALALLGSVALFARFGDDAPPVLWMALYHVPTLLLALAFVLQELPRFEIPPWPRRSGEPTWRARPATPRSVNARS